MSIKIEFMVMVSNSLFSKFGENFKHYFLIFKILREKIYIHTQFKHLIYMIFSQYLINQVICIIRTAKTNNQF